MRSQPMPPPQQDVPAPSLSHGSAQPADHVDVLIVGAGLSGIGVACHLRRRCPGKTFAIIEARGAIGGTWDLFRYPGVRSDSDMFTLGYSFRPWTEAKAIADGPAIREYIRQTARDNGIDRRIRFHHRVVRAEWSPGLARWTVQCRRTDTAEPASRQRASIAGPPTPGESEPARPGGPRSGTSAEAGNEVIELTCDFLFSCTGYYRYDQGYVPEFAGRQRFAGRIVHPQHWPADLDYAGKRVAVIGSGATAVTLVPAMADLAAHVTMVQRSPSYVLSLPSADPVADLLRRRLPARVAHPIVRWKNALIATGLYQLSRRRPALVRGLLRRAMARRLPPGYDIDTHFTPGYQPWDQRMCFVPDGDLFTAIRDGRASVVTGRIETFTERGIRMASGEHVDADVIVTATGLTLQPMGGLSLCVDGQDVDLADTGAYKGMMLSGVPNYAFAVGYTNASWTLKCDLVCEYVCRLLNHMAQRGYRQCTPVAPPPSVPTRPLIDLQAGYILRSLDALPKQG